MKTCRGGFTLVEILTVVVIIGVLASIATVAVINHIEKAKRNATIATMRVIKTSLTAYFMDVGSYPGNLTGLVEDDGNKGWKGSYIDKMPEDGWGRPFRYQVSSPDKYDLVSAGHDMQMDTDDDIRL